MATTIKLQDTSPIIGKQSKLEEYWLTNGYVNFYKDFAGGRKVPVAAIKTVNQLDEFKQHFKLSAIGFGNWVTQEDRYNYVTALFLSFHDIDKILQFKNNIGLNGKVGISFGARGNGGALAHFETGTYIINLTRYKENREKSKKERFLYSGGAGCVAHEYGHALDYYFGSFVEPNMYNHSLSGGDSVRMTMEQGGAFRNQMDKIMNAIIWKEVGKTPSAYYMRLKKHANTEYYLSRCEIFARAFEKYIQYKLHKKGIKNLFLTTSKYKEEIYLTDKEMFYVAKEMDVLIAGMRQVVNLIGKR